MNQITIQSDSNKGINIFKLVIFSSIVFLMLNISFYQIKDNINYFELLANSILLLTTFYLIYVTQKNSTNQSGFYYYTSFGFAFVFFGLFILTLDYVYVYSTTAVKISVKLLFVFGYSLLAIGVTKWIKYNETRQGELSLQANTDELTGLLNRRSFTNFIEFEFNNSGKLEQTFSLIIIDVDYFKLVNDNHGHLVGDEVLKKMARVLNSSFRKADRVSRWGGEEFAILLPGTSLDNTLNIAEKIRDRIEKKSFDYKDKSINITISLGVSESNQADIRVDDIINRADEALYQAKNHNRNCVKFTHT